MARRRKSNRGGWIVLLILIAAGVGVYYFGPWGNPASGDPNNPDGNGTLTGGGRKGGGNDENDIRHPGGLHFVVYDGNEPSPAKAQAGIIEAMRIRNEEPIRARGLLRDALNYGQLPPSEAGRVREALQDLVNRTIFNNSAYVNPRDAYTVGYTMQAGEYLANSGGKKGVISRLNLWVPAEGQVMANGIRSATKLRAGQTYKLLKGPCHAVVHKDQRVMDIYLRDLFVKRMPVAIGKPETPTPEGTFLIVQKVAGSSYYPPVGRGGRVSRPGDEDYPLDPHGYFMKIAGIGDTRVAASDGYAIHGTNEPESIGTAASLGCVRLGPEDIQWAWNMLYETKATVTILP